MLDFICPTCGRTSFDSTECTSCDRRGDDAEREGSSIEP
jgi:hypothetical protein